MADGITRRERPSFSVPSVLSIISAILSFQFGFTLGLIFAILAIVFGIAGMLLALMPQRRGGIVSVISIVLGLIGIIAAAIKLLGGDIL